MRGALPASTVAFLAGAICLAGGTQLEAQPAAAPESARTFEVASLRLLPPGSGETRSITPWGSHQFIATCISLSDLLNLAFDVDGRYILGIPRSLEEVRYTVAARAEGDAGLTYEQIHAPLQALLADRLHLRADLTVAPRNGYHLILEKGPMRLSPDRGKGAYASTDASGLRAQGVSLQTLARILSFAMDEPVLDATGVTGLYDFDIHLSRPDQPDSDQPSLFTALRQQYGLRLIRGRVPVKTLVIHHVDLTPAEN